MSKKVRVHDLAKQYGMSGKDLAAKLRNFGFSSIKSHMSALDDIQVLQAHGVLQANGHQPISDSGDAAASAHEQQEEAPTGLSPFKKKKKKKKLQVPVADASAAPPLTSEGAPVEVAAAAPVATATEAVEVAPAAVVAVASMELAPAEVIPEEAAQPPPAEPIETITAAGDNEASEMTVAEVATAPAPSVPAAEQVASTEAVVSAPTADTPVAEPTAAEASAAAPAATSQTEAADKGTSAPATESPAASQAAAKPATPASPAAKAKAPGAKPKADENAGDKAKAAKRKGNVVGFIDPSSFQQPDRKKPESRRLHSRDDVTPDVRPTYTHDRSRALQRGAGSARGNLTAAQLREREQGRFLRRRGPGGGRGGGTGGTGFGGGRRGRGGGRRSTITDSPLAGGTVVVEEPITIAKLAEALKLKTSVLLKAALEAQFGLFTVNSVLDTETAELMGDEFDVKLEIRADISAEQAHLDEVKLKRSAVEEADLEVRAPTVAFLGHVDHGKTTLIDSIRQSRVAAGESGGITQHIGAYQVKTKLGHHVTIVDTPGHAAFTAMRARGARAVDIVVLVVAGDDGVKPHTEEALSHARAARTPIIVAINKMDKPGFDAQRVMTQLATLELNPEEWGGETAMLNVSGLNGEGVEELLERVFLEGELLELRAHSKGPASGVVLEAEIQQGKGIVAHLLVQDGTLNRGDIILAGSGYGKVKSIHNDLGKIIQNAGPSLPIEVTGLSALPGVGNAFHVVESLAKAKEVAGERGRSERALDLAANRPKSIDLQALLGGEPMLEKDAINLIVRADVQGSVEVLRHIVAGLVHEEVEVKILHSGVGAVTESDIDLAATSDALVIAFKVAVPGKTRMAADRQGVEINRYDVIYEMEDELKMRMEGALAPEYVEEITGHVEIRRLFKSSRIGLIAGCIVLDGRIHRDSKVRLMRDDQLVYTGKIGSLRRESDEAKDVREGFECGIVLKDFRDIKEGDIIEAFKINEVKRTLDSLRAGQ